MTRISHTLLVFLFASTVTSAGEVHLDLGDIVIGGDGCGAVPIGAGIRPESGLLAPAGVFLAGSTPVPGFHPTDGTFGTVNLPFVDGVLTMDGPTRVTSTGTVFTFPATNRDLWDAVRGGVALVDWGSVVIPIDAGDQPSVARPGIGICPNAGITFDLAAIRAAHPGATTARFDAVGGLNLDVNINGVLDAWVLVDGVQKDFQTYGIGQYSVISVPLTNNDQFLTLAFTESNGTIGWDHGVFADAAIVLTGVTDCNANHVFDSCDIDHGTSQDCNTNGIPDECEGGLVPYGAGCPGSGSFTPVLSGGGCPKVGDNIHVELSGGLGGATALLFFGLQEAAIPIGGQCLLNIQPVLPLVVSLPLGGTGAGAGTFIVAGGITPNPLPVLTIQAFVVDAGAAPGYSNTNGLRIEILP